MVNYILALVPFIGAGIGWGTNYLAVRMLFRPYKPVNIIGFELQGLIPKRKHDFALGIGNTVEKELLNNKDITNIIEKINLDADLTRIVEELIPKIRTRIPVLSIVPDEVIVKFKEPIKEELLQHTDTIIKKIIDDLEDGLDLKGTVTERMETFAGEKLEEVVLGIAKRELKHIELIGAVIGFAIGLVQVGLLGLFGA